MRKIKYLLLSITFSLILPIITYAATIEFGEKQELDNIVKYDILYKMDEDETPEDSYTLAINTVNDNLKYELINKNNNSSCPLTNCPILTGTLTAKENIIATLTITNNTETEIKDVKISIKNTDQEKIFNIGPKKVVTEKPSNNSNMSSISFSVGSLDKTFDSNVLEYTVTGIKDTINSVTLTPTCDMCSSLIVTCPTGGCTVSSNNRVALQIGANKVAVNIVSEDKTSNKTYIFNVYRGDIITSSPYLDELKIKDAILSPVFDQLTNDYTAIVGSDIEDLEITTITEDPSATVQIKGDKDLQFGENTVTITVTSSDGENKQVYTIVVTKEEKEQKTTKKVTTTKVNKKKDNKWLIIILSIVALLIIIGSFILIFKKKKQKNKNNKNDKNDKNNSKKEDINEEIKEEELDEEIENTIEKENTDALNILEETRRQMNEEPKTDIDYALDDLMKTKKLELGDLDF